jgi:MscS family membrane protein
MRPALPATWVERVMPQPWARRSLLGVSLAHWTVLAASILVPLLLLRLLAALVVRAARWSITDPPRRALLDSWSAGLAWPLVLALALTIHLALVPGLGFPLGFRIAYARVMLIVAVAALTWLLWRLLTLAFKYTRGVALRRGRGSTRSLLLLGERVVKVVLVLTAVFATLTIAGVDTTTAVAGVGLGGIALALGAQRSVENLLGGIFLLTDRALAVGDMCRISEREGWIEDITLRSVRLRTLEQTLLSIPAGVLAQAGVENYATRSKILVQSTLRLRYGTRAEQLRAVLEGVRGLLEQDSRLEAGSSRIRVVDFGSHAVELELFAYVLTADVPEFLGVREDLLLHVAEIVESSGTGFAQPTQVVYKEEGPNEGGRTATIAAFAAGAGQGVKE